MIGFILLIFVRFFSFFNLFLKDAHFINKWLNLQGKCFKLFSRFLKLLSNLSVIVCLA